MQVLFVNFADVDTTPERLIQLLTTPEEWPQWLPYIDRVITEPDGYSVIRHNSFFNPTEHVRIDVGPDLIRYLSSDGLIEYQLLFRLNPMPHATAIYQFMVLTRQPTLPMSLVTPLLRSTFATNLKALAQLASET
ncbi:SRPBCC family protein [Lacticaseibacillus sp. GG6-2]